MANAVMVGSTQAPAASNPSVFGTIEYAANNAASAASRVSALVDRLCGAVPTADPKGQLAAAPNGLMEEGMRQAASISEAMGRLNEALDRLDRSLP